MKENKANQDEMSQAWDRVGKAMNDASELYLKELETYLGWVGNVQREMLEQTLASTKQLSQIGEAQFALLARMQKNVPFSGMIPAWTELFRNVARAAEAAGPAA